MEERPAEDRLPGEPIAVPTEPATAAPSVPRRGRKAKDAGEGKEKDAPPPDLDDAALVWLQEGGDSWGWDLTALTWRKWTLSHWRDLGQKHTELDRQAADMLHRLEIGIFGPSTLNGTIRLAATWLGRWFATRPGLVNFDNGTLDMATGQQHDFARDDNLTYCLPYEYTPGAHPLITAFLEETIPDRAGQECYLIHCGLALLGDTRIHQMVLLIGAPRSGKSTLLALANALCGQETLGFAGPNLFDRGREGMTSRAVWADSRIVAIDELPVEALQNGELVKIMSAHGGAEMRHMYTQQERKNQWVPKLLLNTNDTPRYPDRSGALTTRLVPIRCPNSRMDAPETQDIFLLDKLLAELPAFVASCLAAADRFLRSGTGRYPLSPAMLAELYEIEQNGDALKSFVLEKCVLTFEEADFISSAALYSTYHEYCRENGNTPFSSKKMVGALKDRWPRLVLSAQKRIGDQVLRGVAGIRWRSAADDSAPPVAAAAFVADVSEVAVPIKPPYKGTPNNGFNGANNGAIYEGFAESATVATSATNVYPSTPRPTRRCPDCDDIAWYWDRAADAYLCATCVRVD